MNSESAPGKPLNLALEKVGSVPRYQNVSVFGDSATTTRETTLLETEDGEGRTHAHNRAHNRAHRAHRAHTRTRQKTKAPRAQLYYMVSRSWTNNPQNTLSVCV